MVQYLSIHKDVSDSACCVVRHTDAGPVRWSRSEPGQVGNQAALSGAPRAFQSACIRMPSYARRGSNPVSAVRFFITDGREAPMYRALYRKWRPQRFEDVVAQRGIVTALRNQIASGRVGHATCVMRQPTPPVPVIIRYTSSTRYTCCPQRPSTPC